MRVFRRPVAAIAGALLALQVAAPAHASLARDRADLAQLQAEDLRLQEVGWKLVTGNARFCSAPHPAIGLLLQDMENYADPARMRAATGIAGDIAVEAAIPGSPAAQAGLAPNDEIVAIDDAKMADLPPAGPNDWKRLKGLHDMIDTDLARDGSVAIAWRSTSDGSAHLARIVGVPACRSRFELLPSKSKAEADGERVLIGSGFSATGYVEDEFAAALAHELAHNILQHRAWLDTVGRKMKNVRLTEREADRMMPWLLANAGYDPNAAVRFFQHWGPKHDGWIFRSRTHDGWDERAKFVAAEIPRIEQLMTEDGQADWRTHFVRTVPAPWPTD
ncbi:PDZ domain-containing protein [Tsuneonella mangrovi]|uniref:PDZ domain-containing protein n=1 Tax=Tsuneonella mangrovi TaxID=1982042 RepID=UPI001F0A57C0|nr:PDZ domain-containing protein [Tsuneonella mangrovi]